MNKKTLLLSLLIFPCISACNYQVPKIDFGASVFENEIIEISRDEIYNKRYVQEDSFFLFVHNGVSCSCWSELKNIATIYNQRRKQEGKEFVPFYSFDCSQEYEEYYNPENYCVTSGIIDLYIISKTVIQTRYTSAAKKDTLLFTTVDGFKEIIDTHIGSEPLHNCYFVNKDFVFSNIVAGDSTNDYKECILITVRNGCPDCSECIPNVLYPYIKNNELRIPVYIFDVQKYLNLGTAYSEIKFKLNLTSESTFGYLDGKVPTYQYWKDGEIVDAGVYQNDIIDPYGPNSTSIITDSYFDGLRDLSYTNIVLINTSVNNYDVDIYQYLNEQHKTILNSFLDYYAKKSD